MKKSILVGTILFAIAFFCAIFKVDISDYLNEIYASINSAENIKTVSSSSGDKEVVTLDKCVDGDTTSFIINGKKKKVRFLSIDTPESVHPYKEVEEYGKNASEYTCHILKNANTIELSYENNLSKTDKYGRILAWVWADNELVQKKLVSIGYAEVKYIYANYSKLKELLEAQEKAKNNKLGIWYDYKDQKYSNKTFTVTFKVSNKEEKVSVKEGQMVELIDNPTKAGYVFSGWTYGSEPYDLSKPIKKNITVKASFSKK